ncbi:MAG: winged helix-turn-helix domain-containing protein [Pyrinomonadaceae bacterium]|nr:winged helix-turn-helix domain-containing protein [Pyrinomonadaceae bacterium]
MSNDFNNLYEFGSFRLNPETNTLWRENELVQLSAKAAELLRLIVEKQGEVVSKDEIFSKVWAETFVEEGVLTQNIYTLRQTLGTDENGKPLIENLKRRGYRITIPVKLNENFQPRNQEIIFATQTRTEIIEEFIETDSSKLLSGEKPFYRRKSTVFFCSGLVFILLASFVGYRMFRQKIRTYFQPSVENVQFLKVTDTGNIDYPSLSPDGNMCVYVRQQQLFLKDIASNKEIRLEIPNVEKFSSVQFSPNGDSIFFRNAEIPRRVANILQVSRFGGETKLIAEKAWANFAVSPDGKNIAFIRNFSEHQTLYLKNLENSEERELHTRFYPENFYYLATPSWSPDGKKIAFIAQAAEERSTKLFVLKAETGAVEEIKSNRLRQFDSAVWLPDGETLIVLAKELGRESQVWKMFYPGGEVQRISNGLNSFEKVSVAADGKKILAMQSVRNSNIFVADSKNIAEQQPLTASNSGNFGEVSLDWIGNGKIIYASSDEKNPSANLSTINISDKTRQILTSNTDFQSDYAKTSADGTIYFLANRGRLINIWRMDNTGENIKQITDGRDGLRLFPAPAPDGKFVYYLHRTRENSSIKRFNLTEQKEEMFFSREDVTPAGFLSISNDGKYLVFLNLKNAIESDDEERGFQATVISIENPNEVKFYKISKYRNSIKFSPDGTGLDYASQNKLVRQDLQTGEIKELISYPQEQIFNFSWSKDGSKLAISRGKVSQDAVLLTGF